MGYSPLKDRRFAKLASIVAMFWMAIGSAEAQLDETRCGSLTASYGPFDYTTVRGNELYLVESAHFTPAVEMLVRGNTGTIAGDLEYTLRVFPNHHRALLSMMRYGERLKVAKVPNARYEVECYFIRAVTFRPGDAVARMLFAKFLLNTGRRGEALNQLAATEPLAGDNAFTHYNLGLSYLQAEQYAEALKQAHRAMALGFTRTELKDQLVAKGKWKELPPPESTAPATAVDGAKAESAPASAP